MFATVKSQQDQISQTTLRYILDYKPDCETKTTGKPLFLHNIFGDCVTDTTRTMQLLRGDFGYTLKSDIEFVQKTNFMGLECKAWQLGNKSWTFVFSKDGRLLAAQYSRTDICIDSQETINKKRLFRADKISLAMRVRALYSVRLISRLQKQNNKLESLVLPPRS